MHNCDSYERFTAVDIECNHVTERERKDGQLRNDSRAEKMIWEVVVAQSEILEVLTWGQSLESRIIKENKALSMKRSHLPDLMVNVQKMHNDIERSSKNDGRRLESQIQLLEHQRFVFVALSEIFGVEEVLHSRYASAVERREAKCPVDHSGTRLGC